MVSDSSSVELFVLRAISVACAVAGVDVDRNTPLLDLRMDSLTLVAVLSQVEAVFQVDFSTAETLDLLGAASVGELVAAIERRLAQHRAL